MAIALANVFPKEASSHLRGSGGMRLTCVSQLAITPDKEEKECARSSTLWLWRASDSLSL